jgi:hypothetical protein
MTCMRSTAAAIAVAALVAGCESVPTGPSLMVLPGQGKSFEQFQADDAACRLWAAGRSPQQAPSGSAVGGAAVGTAIGAAAGAGIGAAAGSPAAGAAAGAGVGLVGGTAMGASAGEGARTLSQRRYDTTYVQCMYAKGNQVPVPRGIQYSPGPHSLPPGVPPPPAGVPPPPPPGVPH